MSKTCDLKISASVCKELLTLKLPKLLSQLIGHPKHNTVTQTAHKIHQKVSKIYQCWRLSQMSTLKILLCWSYRVVYFVFVKKPHGTKNLLFCLAGSCVHIYRTWQIPKVSRRRGGTLQKENVTGFGRFFDTWGPFTRLAVSN